MPGTAIKQVPSTLDNVPGQDTCARICLTPTRNESWIIRPFLAAAKSWADHVIVADQGSSDGTAEEISGTPQVTLVRNEAVAYEESHRQRLLLQYARQIPGKRILIGLDADEALSANATTSNEWESIESAAPGTILRFRWVNVLPGFRTAWVCPGHVPLGFVDNGADHVGKAIHSPRVPQPEGAPVLDLHEIVVLHFQYVLWDRMRSKQRWYQAWEYLKHQTKNPVDIYRQYNHMHGGWNFDEIVPLKHEWLAGFEHTGIDFRSLTCEPITWWDREVVQMLVEHGPRYFRRIGIWEKDWPDVARRLGIIGTDLRDPRTLVERAIHRLLASTQSSRGRLSVRAFERVLRMAGW